MTLYVRPSAHVRARASRRRIARHRRSAGPVRRRRRRDLSPHRHARRARPLRRRRRLARRPRSSGARARPSSGRGRRAGLAGGVRARLPGRRRSTRWTTARRSATIAGHIRRVQAAGGDHVRSRRRLRPHRSHRHQPVHDRGHRGRGGSVVRAAGGDREPHRVSKLYFIAWSAGEVGGLSGGAEASRLHRRRRGAPRDAVAGLGDHDRHRHQPRVAGGVARRLVPQDADVDLRPARATCPTSTSARSGARRSSTACSAASTAAARAKPISSRGCDDAIATARSEALRRGARRR